MCEQKISRILSGLQEVHLLMVSLVFNLRAMKITLSANLQFTEPDALKTYLTHGTTANTFLAASLVTTQL